MTTEVKVRVPYDQGRNVRVNVESSEGNIGRVHSVLIQASDREEKTFYVHGKQRLVITEEADAQQQSQDFQDWMRKGE